MLEAAHPLPRAESRKEVLGANPNHLPSVPDALQISLSLIAKSFNVSILLFLLRIMWINTVLIHKGAVKIKRH